MPLPMRAEALEAPTPATDPRDEADRLALRLEDGYQRIEQALAAGGDVSAWEAFWLHLLAEYERLCDRLDLAA